MTANSDIKILVINTGGTIGMVRTDRGFAPCADLSDRLGAALEATGRTLPDIKFLDYDPPLDSSNMRPADWYHIASDIRDQQADHDGIIVLHGTDTMAYTAPALGYLLGDLEIPVVLTGSQIPLSEPDNDALSNFLGALDAIQADRRPLIQLFFNGRLMRGSRISKIRTDGFDGFDMPRGEGLKDIPPLRAALTPTPSALEAPARVGVASLYPGIDATMINAMAAAGFQALVLETYGGGHGPDNDAAFLASLKQATEGGLAIVAVSHCQHGRVDFSRYATGQALAEAGLIGGLDMTREAAFAKLQVLLDCGVTPDRLAELMARNLAGELSPA